MPPGRRSFGSGGEAGTSLSYVDTTVRSGHRKRAHVWVVAAPLLWASIYVGEHHARWGQLRVVTLCAVVVVVGLWWFRRLAQHVVVATVCVAGVSAGAHAWHHGATVVVGPCTAIATLRNDPQLFAAGTSAVVEVEGRRYRASAFGVAGRRLAQRVSGESVLVSGMCEKVEGDFARRDRIQHIVGKMSIETVSEDFGEGSPFIRAANRIRSVISAGVASMSAEGRSLFLGLVIGDDRAQSQEMVQRFRDSGLSHLCAVSGQNVAFLLLLIRPLIARRHRAMRWAITILVIAWFVVVTRGEPSIVRASVMAALVATSSFFGRTINTRIVLSMTVCGLLLIDPMLAWSVGFALSVAATAGLAWFSASCERLLGGGQTIASTLAAQIGTTPISLFVFGTAPVISLLSNPFAIPVAGFVMTVGLPLSVLAALIPALEEPVAYFLTFPVWWVDAVSRVSSHISPSGIFNFAAWVCVVAYVIARRRHVSRQK